MKLIDGWKKVLVKSYSNLASYAQGIVITLYLVVPTMNDIPPEIKNSIPVEYLPYVSLFLLVCSILGRVIQQPKIHKTNSILEQSIFEKIEDTPTKDKES